MVGSSAWHVQKFMLNVILHHEPTKSREQNQCHAIMRTPLNRALAVRFVHCAPVVCTTVVHINRTSLDNRKASSIWKGQLWLLRHGNGSQNCTRPAKQAHYDLKHFSGIAKLV